MTTDYDAARKYGDKSHVGLETAICPLCGKEHETSNLLLDTFIRPKGEEKIAKYTPTHYEPCPEHAAMAGEYVGIAVLEREPYPGEDQMKVPRTGGVMHIRRSVWPSIFNVPTPQFMCCMDSETADKIKVRVQPE